MNKGNKLLVSVVIILSIVLAYYLLGRSGGTLRAELKDFAIDDTATVDRIFIADKLGHTSLLEKKGPAFWTVNGKYQARQDGINNVLTTLLKMTVKAPVAKSMEANVLKDLSGPLQRKVEVYAGGKKIKTIYMAGETLDKMGTFMLLENSSVPFEVQLPGHRGFLQTRFIADERMWRDQSIFAYEKHDIRQIEVKYHEQPGNSFTIEIPDHGSLFLKGISSGIDTMMLNRYVAQYRKFVYEYIVTDETFPASRKDSILSSEPFIEINVTDRKGERRTMKSFHRKLAEQSDEDPSKPFIDPERIYGLVNNVDFVLIQYYQLDRLAVPVSQFAKQNQN